MASNEFFDKEFEIFIDKDLSQVIDEINKAGVAIDEDRLDYHIKEYKEIENKANNDFVVALMKEGLSASINSRKDILRVFFDELKLPVYKSTKTGPSLDAEALSAIEDMHPAVKAYKDFKSAHAMLNTLNGIKAALRDGRVYPHHNIAKAASGRFSSSGENGDKLNINGWSKRIRDILKPMPDTVVVSFDYRNMEGTVSAALSKQTDMLEDIINDVDTHQKLADILGIDRAKAKIINHGINYGMSAFGLGRRLGISEEEAQSFIDRYWAGKDKIKTHKENVIQLARIYGYVQTIGGTRRPSFGVSDNAIWSSYIQGSAADIFKNAVVAVSKYLKQVGGDVVTIMHDAIVVEIPTGENFDQIKAEVANIMETIHPSIPLKVDTQIGKW